MSLIRQAFSLTAERFSVKGPIAVAVSGGADSVALLKAAADWAKERGIRVLALTVDHGLRPESQAEAAFVKRLCGAFGIEHKTLTWEGKKPVSGVEKAAREKRYALLFDACRREKTPFLFLGHHKRDQAETFLMRRARKSGDVGLAAMSVVRTTAFCKLLRPFLGLSPEMLRDFDRENGLPWAEDPTNASDVFERGRLRASLTDEIIEDAFRQTLSYGAKRRAAEEETAAFYRSSVTLAPQGYAVFGPDSLKDPSAASVYGIGEVLRVVGRREYAPDTAALIEKARAPSFGGATLGGCRIAPCAKGKTLVWQERAALPAAESVANLTEFFWNGFLFAASAPLPDGARVGALGRPFKGDFRIPKRVIPVLPSVFENEKLFIVPHLGYRRNQISCRAAFAPSYPLITEPEWTPPFVF